MPTHIDPDNPHDLEALKPLFQPWQLPDKHRVKNPKPGGNALVEPGRRPSRLHLVRGIRQDVDRWRSGGYAGVSPTSRALLLHWFETDHPTANGGIFRYHFAQRESIETIIYLYEVCGLRHVADLLSEYGGDLAEALSLGINPADDRWLRACCKVATGGGKTKIMSLAIVWSYFHSLREPNSDLPRHFIVIAPNLTVYERLKDDFENGKIFHQDPLIPEEWQSEFDLSVILQDEPGGAERTGALYLTNIHRLYEARTGRGRRGQNADNGGWLLGPEVSRAGALDTSMALRERIARHPRLLIINDEAHHLHDDELQWNKAIGSLHDLCLAPGGAGVALQLDFTATPKYNNGDYFRHVICDFPLGEAVDAGIVKVPLLGESDILRRTPDDTLPVVQRYEAHLKLGYESYSKTYTRFEKEKKPILFVMTESSEAANQIAAYLNDNDDFPLLKNRVLNLHINLKGKIKKTTRGGKTVLEFVESEDDIKPEDLQALRLLSRQLDADDSPYRCVVSVLMLREGWDVKNVTVIVPLRPYKADSGILPEQTLGRGLRRMFSSERGIVETAVVVEHPAFRQLYQEELEQEGFDIISTPLEKDVRQTAQVFVDFQNKPVDDLNIDIPHVSDSIETLAEMEPITFEEVQAKFQGIPPLRIGNPEQRKIEYKESTLFTGEVVTSMEFLFSRLRTAYLAADYFTQLIGRACKLPNPTPILKPLMERFIQELLFERPVDLYSGEVDHRMRDGDVREVITAVFTPLVMSKRTEKVQRKHSARLYPLSGWAPFVVGFSEDKPVVPCQRTMFNLTPCDSGLEQEFALFCDRASDVAAFAKNAGPQKLRIDYLKPDGRRAFYEPDFMVRLTDGTCLLVETKGRVDTLVSHKARAAVEWCKTASKSGVKWSYLYVQQHIFDEYALSAMSELVGASQPALSSLIREANTLQAELDFGQAAAEQVSEDRYAVFLQKAGVSQFPAELEETMRRVVNLLDYDIRTGSRDFAHIFQPMLRWLDEYALKLMAARIGPHVPADQLKRQDFFDPYPPVIGERQIGQLKKNQQYLERNLVYGQSIQRLGTLLFCLHYAQRDRWGAKGVWQVVASQFAGNDMAELYALLEKINDFRNTKVAHVEQPLEGEDNAWQGLYLWARGLELLAKLAG